MTSAPRPLALAVGLLDRIHDEPSSPLRGRALRYAAELARMDDAAPSAIVMVEAGALRGLVTRTADILLAVEPEVDA
jgi:hypothetical protein